MIVRLWCVLLASIMGLGSASSDEYTALEHKILESLSGSWAHFDVYYRFESESELTVIRDGDGSHDERRFSYTLTSIDDRSILTCEPQDGGGTLFLLKGEVSDSTAVLSLGAAFVRADSSRGLTGTWERSYGFCVMRMVFAGRSVEFTETRFDSGSGQMEIMESRSGTFAFVSGKRGQIRVTFDSGETAEMVPLVAGDIMYLFDLSPRKSLFVKKPLPPEATLMVDNRGEGSGAAVR